MVVEATLFANVHGFRGLLIWAGLAYSQVFCVATLRAPFPLLHLRGPRDLSGCGASTISWVCMHVCEYVSVFRLHCSLSCMCVSMSVFSGNTVVYHAYSCLLLVGESHYAHDSHIYLTFAIELIH